MTLRAWGSTSENCRISNAKPWRRKPQPGAQSPFQGKPRFISKYWAARLTPCPMSALGQKQTYGSFCRWHRQTRQRRSLSQREAIRAPGWAYWGKAQDKHRKARRSGDLLGRCDILEVEIRDAPGDKQAHFDSDFSAGRQAWPRCVHPMRRTTRRSLSEENASRHYKAKCGLWTDYSRSGRPMGVRRRHKLEMHGRLDWRGSCSWN